MNGLLTEERAKETTLKELVWIWLSYTELQAWNNYISNILTQYFKEKILPQLPLLK